MDVSFDFCNLLLQTLNFDFKLYVCKPGVLAYPSMLASWFEKSSLIGWSLKRKETKHQPISDIITQAPLDYAQYRKHKSQRELGNESDDFSDSSSDISSRLSGYDPSLSSCSDLEYFTALSSQGQSDSEDLLNSSLSSPSDLEADQDQRSLASKSGSCLSSDLEYITAATYSSFSEYESSSLRSDSYRSALANVARKQRSRPASWDSDLEYETARSHLSASASDLDMDDVVTPKPRSKRDLEFRYYNNGNNNNNVDPEGFSTKYQYRYSGYSDSDLTPIAKKYGNYGNTDSDVEYSTAVSDLSDFEGGVKSKRDFLKVKLHVSGKLLNTLILNDYNERTKKNKSAQFFIDVN